MTHASVVSIDSWGMNFKNSGRKPKVVKISECGDHAVIIDDFDQVQTLCLSTGECWRVPIKGRAQSVALSASGEFAVASDLGSVQRFDLTLPTIPIGNFAFAGVSSIAYDHTGEYLLVAHSKGKVSIYDLQAFPHPQLIAQHRISDRNIPLLCARQNSMFGVDSTGRLFYLHDFQTESSAAIWNGSEGLDFDCYTMAVHPAFPRIVVGGFGRYVRLYSAHNSSPVHLVTSFGFIRDLYFMANFNLLAVVGDSGLEVWNLEKNCLELCWKSSKGNVLAVRSMENLLRVLYG